MTDARSLLLKSLLMILLATTAATAAPVGDLTGIRRDGEAVLLDTSSGAVIRLEFPAADILRLQAGPGGVLTGEGSGQAPIVLAHTAEPVGVIVTSTAGFDLVTTPVMALCVHRQPLRFEMYRADRVTLLWRELKPLELAEDGSFQTLGKRANEHFFGGGQQNGAFEFAGRELEISYSGGWEEGDRPNPAPFYLSSAGYGVLRNTWTDGAYDFRSEDYLTTRHEEHRFDAYYFVGDTIREVLDRYTWLTGRAPLLPRWAFGYGDADCYNDRDNADKPGTVPEGWSDGTAGAGPDKKG